MDWSGGSIDAGEGKVAVIPTMGHPDDVVDAATARPPCSVPVNDVSEDGIGLDLNGLNIDVLEGLLAAADDAVGAHGDPEEHHNHYNDHTQANEGDGTQALQHDTLGGGNHPTGGLKAKLLQELEAVKRMQSATATKVSRPTGDSHGGTPTKHEHNPSAATGSASEESQPMPMHGLIAKYRQRLEKALRAMHSKRDVRMRCPIQTIDPQHLYKVFAPHLSRA